MKIELTKKRIECKVKYAKRKSLMIKLELPGGICVTAPYGMVERDVLEAVMSKKKWIEKRLREIEEVGIDSVNKEYENGEKFLYLGRACSLDIKRDKACRKAIVALLGDSLIIRIDSYDAKEVKGSIEDWYRRKTKEIISERVESYQKHFDQRPIDIRIKRQKCRWGSCSFAHRLNFNLKCAMAPIGVIDYIVVHEMCHMVHFNHSKEFWTFVESVLPGYKEPKAWLKKYGITMSL